ncbi:MULTISPECIES: TrbG/VirB9 family P-type conjugative transfer protein [Paraburkholderia]|uniref:TrbG/VirB9 family P-type conjugative transfer protein n=1 Tax=Paraburkholderia phytofirmans TaxID=261302 RepID=A0ABW9BI19_9BURK|nr:TrbG/VirB9 family P-type conjugative transfer protein [Paraburkholderia sp. USG1]MDR8398463.1 TrbG/VirB9 family P-type conjugative transfer protein [Paraburkholderia sp. USG1]
MNVILTFTCTTAIILAAMSNAVGQISSIPPDSPSPIPASAPVAASSPSQKSGDRHAVPVPRAERHEVAHRPLNGPYPAPDSPSLVVYDYDPDYLYPVYVRTNEETHLVFGADEEVTGVYLSDTGKRWLQHTALTKRDVFIEARLPGLDNAATIITSHRRYEIDLRSSDDGKVYHRVSWHYLDADIETATARTSPFGIEYPGNVPASGGAVPDAGTDDATATSDARHTVAPRIGLDHTNFDYRVEGTAPFAPLIVFDDGHFTFLQFPHRAELPAILLMDEKGQAEIASFVPLGNDFYEVQQTVQYGLLLRRGKQEVKVFNGRGNGCGIFGCDSARMKNVYGGR